VVAQGCRPISPWRTVTRSRGNVVLEIDGAPAFQAFAEVAREPLASDLGRAARSIMVALPAGGGGGTGTGGGETPYVVRGIAGFEPERGWLGLGQPVAEGTQLRFVLREAAGAREALTAACEQLARELAGRRPLFGLYFDCAGRGQGLFGLPGHDLAFIVRALGELPLIGVFGAAELGPAAVAPGLPPTAAALHLFSGVLVVFTAEGS
jgi:small ligand-binding sensory domain FIST